jgi:hypothetical protein
VPIPPLTIRFRYAIHTYNEQNQGEIPNYQRIGMSVHTDLSDLQRRVQYLVDRAEILDCISRHARGHDRHDSDLLTSSYHDDGIDEHGNAVNPGPKYAEWANPQHAAGSQSHQHHITTHNCEIEGDVAHCDSYVIVVLLNHDGVTTRLISGRYVDRLERRNGLWKLVVRKSTVEAMLTADASMLQSEGFKSLGYPRGSRDRHDLSYERPLLADTASGDRW